MAHDPMYTPDELRSLGFVPWERGQPCDGAIIHTPQSDDAALLAGSIPGLRAVFDGRLGGASWIPPGVPVIELGRPAAETEGENKWS